MKFSLISILLVIVTESIICNALDVKVYTDINHQGTSFDFILNGTSENECMSPLPPLVDSKISSVNTGGGCINLYKAQNCEGEFAVIKPGNPMHNDLRHWKGFHDAVRSIGPCFDPCHEKMIEKRGEQGNLISLFEHVNYKGFHVSMDLNTSVCVELSVKMKRRVTSLKTFGNFCVELHHNWDCSGPFIDVRAGSPSHENLLYWWGNDDQTSAVSLCGLHCGNNTVQLRNNTKRDLNKNSLMLFDEKNLQGNFVPIDLEYDDCYNIEDEWDGQTQSIQLGQTECIIIFEDFNCSQIGRNLTLNLTNTELLHDLARENFDRIIQSVKNCSTGTAEMLNDPRHQELRSGSTTLRKLVIVFLILLFILGIGLAGFFIYTKFKNSPFPFQRTFSMPRLID